MKVGGVLKSFIGYNSTVINVRKTGAIVSLLKVVIDSCV